MAEDNFTLTTFYTSWKAYQDHLKAALAPLTTEQLALRAAPGLRSVGENAMHIVGCRTFWFTEFLGENGGEEMKAYASWNKAALSLGALSPLPPSWPRESNTPGNLWPIVWRAGVPPICARLFLTTGMACPSKCHAPGWFGTCSNMTCTTAVRSRSRSAPMGSRRNSPSETPYMSDCRGNFETSPCVGTPLAASV